MSAFYEPTLLFRQNAIRRSPYSSPASSTSSLCLDRPSGANGSSAWLLNSSNAKDTELMSKICALDRLNISSNYWRIPDSQLNLTSMATSVDDDDVATLAISSGSNSSNLFIYEVDLEETYLTHHNTISLPNIHSMKWVPNASNMLMTGNDRGYAHLISVPGFHEVDESAEIIKRFNHRKHLKMVNKDSNMMNHKSTNITKMEFLDRTNLMSIYDDNLYHWDFNETSMKPKPISITSINGLMSFDSNKFNSNLLAVCGKFGVSLFDTRDPHFSIPAASLVEANKKRLAANLIKWSPESDHIFASAHLDGVIRLWDIRKQDNFGSLYGNSASSGISSIEWNEYDLFSGGRDGNVIHWDLTTNRTNGADLGNCTLKEGFDSVSFDAVKNVMEKAVNERQCGTILPASNTKIIALESVATSTDVKVLSIDGSSFFGLHSKIYNAVYVDQSKQFYSNDDLRMMTNETSEQTLVDTEPLQIARKPTIETYTEKEEEVTLKEPLNILTHHKTNSFKFHDNLSNETLLDSPVDSSRLNLDFGCGSDGIFLPNSAVSNGSVDTIVTELADVKDEFSFVPTATSIYI